MNWLFALLLLLFPTALNSSVEVYGAELYGAGTVSAAGGDFCDTDADGLAADLCEDFEEGVNDCTTLTTGPTVTGSPDCDDSTTPLAGAYQADLPDDATTDAITWDDDVDGPVSCTTSEDCEVRFLIELAGSAVVGFGPVAGLYGAGGSPLLCEIEWDPDDNLIRMQGQGGYSSSTALSDGQYKFCFWYDYDVAGGDDCFLDIDPVAGTYCAGATATINRYSTVGHVAVDQFIVHDGTDFFTVEVDNIHLLGGGF